MLEHLVRQEISKKGFLPQDRFMELALHHPKYGYYRSQEAVSRDFTTSPEVSQVFGELIGIWAIEYYSQLKCPQKISLVELGPGKGTLMSDFLRSAQKAPLFDKALNIHFVEMNPLLKIHQRKAIYRTATWVEHFANIPFSSDPLVILANEFFDVLPTKCYVRENNILYERCIENHKGELVFTFMKQDRWEGPDQLWEESPTMDILMSEICHRLLVQSGVFLCIDYGYETGMGDSLQALFKGKPSHPLSHIGKSDLTCHVNFKRLKEIALAKNLGVCGPIPQGEFLKNIGLDLRIKMLKDVNSSHRDQLEAARMRLTHPHQMGYLFKVMAVFSPAAIEPIGFDL